MRLARTWTRRVVICAIAALLGPIIDGGAGALSAHPKDSGANQGSLLTQGAPKDDGTVVAALRTLDANTLVRADVALRWDGIGIVTVGMLAQANSTPAFILNNLTPAQRLLLSTWWQPAAPGVDFGVKNVELNEVVEREIQRHNADLLRSRISLFWSNLDAIEPRAELLSHPDVIPPLAGIVSVRVPVGSLVRMEELSEVYGVSVLPEKIDARLNKVVPALHITPTWRGEGLSPLNGQGIRIGIVDSGVQTNLVDVEARADFSGENLPGVDGCGHGTAVAGLVASRAVGFPGPGANATILDAKLLGADCSDTQGSFADATSWAINHGADIISLSIGPDQEDVGTHVWDVLIDRDVEAYGVFFVVAVGNSGDGPRAHPLVPAGAWNGFGIGAMADHGKTDPKAYTGVSWSNWGFTNETSPRPKPDIVAPGARIDGTLGLNTTVPGTSLIGLGGWPEACPCHEAGHFISGTSFSTPLVAGAAARLLSHYHWGADRRVDLLAVFLINGVNPAQPPDPSGGYNGSQRGTAWGLLWDGYSTTWSGTVSQGTTWVSPAVSQSPFFLALATLHWVRPTTMTPGVPPPSLQLDFSCAAQPAAIAAYPGNAERAGLFVAEPLVDKFNPPATVSVPFPTCTASVQGLVPQGSQRFWVGITENRPGNEVT